MLPKLTPEQIAEGWVWDVDDMIPTKLVDRPHTLVMMMNALGEIVGPARADTIFWRCAVAYLVLADKYYYAYESDSKSPDGIVLRRYPIVAERGEVAEILHKHNRVTVVGDAYYNCAFRNTDLAKKAFEWKCQNEINDLTKKLEKAVALRFSARWINEGTQFGDGEHKELTPGMWPPVGTRRDDPPIERI